MTEFPHIILDDGEIVSPSFGREYSMFHIQFLADNADKAEEIFKKLSDVCNAKWPTKQCPDCKGEGSTPESSKAGTLCFTCKGKCVVAEDKN